ARLDGDPRARRAWCLVFESGDAVVAVLTEFARTQRLRGAHVRAVGALSEATIAWFDPEAKTYRDQPVREQVEVAALLGDVTLAEDGAVKVHLHCVLGRRDGSAIAGHLREGRVLPTLEMFVVEEGLPLRRRMDEASGLELIA